jgi:transposase, IS6 family
VTPSVRSPGSAFAGFRFPPEVILLAVRWCLRYGLSYRDLEELLAERGIEVDHVTLFRWVQRFTPILADAARPCRHRVGGHWFVDERYVKVSGTWRYVYRAHTLVRVVAELLPAALHDTNQYANNRVEADHGRLKARLRTMRGLKQDRTASVVIRGRAFIQNLRRGHDELESDARPGLTLAAAFDELERVIRPANLA